MSVAKGIRDRKGSKVGALRPDRGCVAAPAGSSSGLRLAGVADWDHYEWLSRTMVDAFWMVDLSGKILLVNDLYAGMLGYTADELIGLQYENLTLPKWREMDRGAIERGLAEGRTPVYEKELIRKDGTTIPVELRTALVKDDQGDPVGLWAVVRDVSGRVAAQTALLESEKRFHDFVEASPYGAHQYELLDDDRLVFTGFNRAADRILGVKHAELIGKTLEETFPQLITTEIPRAYRRVALEGEPFEIDQQFYREGQIDGSFEVSAFQTGPRKVAALFRDITERKKAELKIVELNSELERRVAERTAQLEAANRELEAFSYSVSHDLRSPLRAIDGFSRILMEDYAGRLDEEGLDLLERVCKSADRMNELVENMLRLSRLSRVELNLEEADLSAVAREVVLALAQGDPSRVVDVSIPEGVTGWADPSLARALLENLLGNAWKYTSRTPKARIEFGFTSTSEHKVYFIRDNGAGFDMAYAENLFGAFHRLHTADEFPGLGIGLAIAQRIVRRHGGRIWADAEVGKGATFYFTFGE